MTEIVRIHRQSPEPELLTRAAQVLQRGGLVAFPTETVYGLGANALDAAACRRIFTVKGRPPNNPIIVHVADAAAAQQVANVWPQAAARLAAHFWPGPLTLVLPRRATVPDVVTAGGPTVAVRVPAHPVAQALLRTTGLPIAAPSANRSGELSPTRAEHVARGLGTTVDLILDAGPTPGGLESTVLDLSRTPPVLLRPGLVKPTDLQTLIGPLVCRITSPDQVSEPLPSPGLLARHYAPRTPLWGVEGTGEAEVRDLVRQGQRVGWVPFGTLVEPRKDAVQLRILPIDPAGYAAQLYATLHDLDAAGLDVIVLALPPNTEDWLAVRDRLRRACAR